MKIRPAHGCLLSEAMEQVVVVNSRAELLAAINLRMNVIGVVVTDDQVTVRKYGYGIDERNGWDTHLICIDGKAFAFSDGPEPWALT